MVAALSLALSAERRDYCLVVVCELLTVVASLAMMHGLQGMQASVVAIHGLQEHRLSSCGIRASCPTACGISLDQGSNPYPLHCRVDSYPLYHQGSPRTRYIFIFINTLKIFFFLLYIQVMLSIIGLEEKKNRWLTLFQKCSCL